MSALVLTAGFLVVGALPAFQQSAGALPPACPDGSPPPCSPPDTDPTTTTTQPPRWVVNVLTLNQDPAGLTGAVAADRFWITSLSSPPTAAGSAGLSGGRFSFPATALPSGKSMVLRVREGGSPGSLCRTTPRAPVPASGRTMHILVAPPITMDATSLPFLGSVITSKAKDMLPASEVFESVGITPQADGLHLEVRGKVVVLGVLHFDFVYRAVATLAPVNGPDTARVLDVQLTGPGTTALTWSGTPEGTDQTLNAVKASLNTQLGVDVPNVAGAAVNPLLTGLPQVTWWTAQGFTVSLRRATYSDQGVVAYPALCRFS